MDMKHLIKQMFTALAAVSATEYPHVLELPTYSFPKKSKILSTNLLKDVNAAGHPRQLVITGHLYLDYILQRMLDRESHNLSAKQLESFYAKADWLHKNGRLDARIFHCLLQINKLRNSFAHEIFYDLADWSPVQIPYVHEYKLKVPVKKNLLRAFNIILLKMCFFALVIELETDHDWLIFENIPK